MSKEDYQRGPICAHTQVSLLLAVGLALGLALLVFVSTAGSRVAQALGPCDRWVLGIDASDSSDCSDEAHPCKTVQYAINQSVEGDVICIADHMLAPGPTVYQETIDIDHSLTLDGKWEAACVDPSDLTCAFSPVACDPSRVVLDAAGAGRVIQIHGLISPTIDCFTITGGDAAGQGGDPDGNDAGGGIFSQDAAPVIIHNVITANYGCDVCPTAYGRGGGLYLLNAPATTVISGNLIAYNVADESTWGQGGGIVLRDSDAQVLHNTIEYNRAGHSAGDGGGIAIRGGAPTIAYNDILSNVAGVAVMGNGGGIFAWFTASVTIEDNYVYRNIALDGASGSGLTSHGGGIYYHGYPSAAASIQRNRVVENTAARDDTGYGGGLYLSSLNQTDLIVDNTVYGNFAAVDGDGDGGGIYVHASDAVLSGGRIEANYGSPGGEGRGGGLFVNDSTVLLSSAVISSNIAGGINGFGRGGGTFISNTVASLVDNQYIFNRAALYNPPWPGSGGAVEMYNSPGSMMRNNLFDRNRAPVYGGAVFVQASDGVTLAANTLSQNQALYGGGGYILYSDEVLFDANIIVSNVSSGGAGLYLYDSAAALLNNILADNELTSAGQGAGLWVHGNKAFLRHNTLARNRNGSGVQVSGYWGGDGTADLVNTILVSHTVGINVSAGCTATLEATLWGSGPWANGLDMGGAGSIAAGIVNLWADPGFVAPSVHDYHLTLASAAVDAGVATTVTTDVDGHFRPYGTAPDLGADEIVYAAFTPGLGGHLVFTDTQGNPTAIQAGAGVVPQAIRLVYTPLFSITTAPRYHFAGHAFDLQAYIRDTLQPGFAFDLPMVITIHYSDQDVAGLVEEDLTLLNWTGGSWEDAACGPYSRSLSDNWLSVPVCHLSQFAMQGRVERYVHLPIILRVNP